MKETIVAPSTPWGYSAIGIIRVSGPAALKYTCSLFQPGKKSDRIFSPEPGKMYTGILVSPDTQEPYDEVMVCYMQAPRSYTGDNMVEIYCHGNPVIMQMTLKLYLKMGARMAEPGEFTRRAFLNGKMDLLQAESVNQIIQSRTVQGEKAAFKILEGRLSRIVDSMKKNIVHLLSQLHVNIDFPTEIDVEIPRTELKKISSRIQKKIERLLSSYEYGSRLQSGLKVVIAGAPNVGKSSLFNALLVEDRALVTSIPGTTRDALREIINIHGIPITLIDTAGLRQTQNKVEKLGIDLTRKVLDEADLVLLLLDGGRKAGMLDTAMMQCVESKSNIVVLNKSDLLDKERAEYYHKRFPKHVAVSSLTGKGLDDLNDRIYKAAVKVQPQSSDIIITSVRHKIALETAYEALQDFDKAVDSGLSEEILLVDLEKALRELQAITGEIATDDILDVIFGQFCLGK